MTFHIVLISDLLHIVTDAVVAQELEWKCRVADLAEEVAVAVAVEAAEGEVIPPETGQYFFYFFVYFKSFFLLLCYLHLGLFDLFNY